MSVTNAAFLRSLFFDHFLSQLEVVPSACALEAEPRSNWPLHEPQRKILVRAKDAKRLSAQGATHHDPASRRVSLEQQLQLPCPGCRTNSMLDFKPALHECVLTLQAPEAVMLALLLSMSYR
eukprot:1159800-Pelagomonas_calceolata.AAC.1